jgi:transcription initiation factor TFIIH subunit 1
MTSLQASSNEFLRQFWSAVLPAKVGDVSANALATPAQKAGKAERMKGYLMKMEDRVVGLFKEAEGLRLDLIRVEAVRCLSSSTISG